MISFTLTDEQKQLQALARDFTKNEITPKAAYHDETAEYPLDILKKAWELGLMNNQIPEVYGGPGLSVVDGCIVSEETAAGCTAITTAMEANMLASAPILVGASEELKKEFHEHWHRYPKNFQKALLSELKKRKLVSFFDRLKKIFA